MPACWRAQGELMMAARPSAFNPQLRQYLGLAGQRHEGERHPCPLRLIPSVRISFFVQSPSLARSYFIS